MDFTLFDVSEPFSIGCPTTGFLGVTFNIEGKKTLMAISHECIHEIASYTGEATFDIAMQLFQAHKTEILCGLYDQLLLVENEQRYLVKRKNGQFLLEPY